MVEASQSTEDYEILNVWDLLDTAPLQIDGSWSYYCASAQTAQGDILARDNPKGNQAAIFRRFYREEEVHEQQGVGIGLYLSREIVTRQGGYQSGFGAGAWV